jgi:hypothetical protein
MKRAFVFALCAPMLAIAICAGPLGAQAPTWVRSEKVDALRNSSYTQFELLGKFLVAPRSSSRAQPVIVVQCQAGHHRKTNGGFISGWIDTGAVLDSQTGHNGGSYLPVEFRLDSGKLQSENWGISTDFSSIEMAQIFCWDCNLANLLYGHTMWHKPGTSDQIHKVIIGVAEHLGSEIQMQFDMPDPTEVADVCGILRRD